MLGIHWDEKPTDQEISEIEDILARRSNVINDIFELHTLRDGIDKELLRWHEHQHDKVYCKAMTGEPWRGRCSRKNGHGPDGLYCWQHAKQFTPRRSPYADWFGVS